MNRDDVLKVYDKLSAIDITLARNTALLDEHMRRTELLESDIKPLKAHVQLINNAAKIALLILGAVSGAYKMGLLKF